MSLAFRLENDVFVLENFNQARPFSSFLPGIAGEHGKPLWVFYVNRGQCIASFGVRDKNGAMLEFYPADRAYQLTPLLGFRTFIRVGAGRSSILYEPFKVNHGPGILQEMRVHPEELEIRETNRPLGLTTSIATFNLPNEAHPLLAREVRIENRSRRPVRLEVVDGLPQVVPFGLGERFLKLMSRTMQAFAGVEHLDADLPFYKMKMEPSDRPEIETVAGGFMAFAVKDGKAQPMIVDPQLIFGADTSFQSPQALEVRSRLRARSRRTEAMTASSFSVSQWTLTSGESRTLQTYYGYTATWELASTFRARVAKEPSYFARKRAENTQLIKNLTGVFDLHSGVTGLAAYARQTFLDNMLRGGKPFILPQAKANPLFHCYLRKHGDLERDYNFFELSPTRFSQGNGNYRDVSQNRRSEVWLYAGVDGGALETFFNLIQLDGFNPLVIRPEKFYLDEKDQPAFGPELAGFLGAPFSPGELMDRLLERVNSKTQAEPRFREILAKSKKIQEADHLEGFWNDHWTYNLDLLENFLAVFPDKARALLVGRRDFTYYDNDHVVQPRHRKYVLRADGSVRQQKAVIQDAEKSALIRSRAFEPHKVRVQYGRGDIYSTSLLVKVLGMLAVKAAALDPFGMGLEMEADKPGWCDSLNGLPGLLGSCVGGAFELRRWATLLRHWLPELLKSGETHLFPVEVAEFLQAVGDALSQAHPDDFYPTWDALNNLKEAFRARTRLGLSGEEAPVGRAAIESFLGNLDHALEAGLKKAYRPDGVCTSYFINEIVRYERLPPEPVRQTSGKARQEAAADPHAKPVQTVRALEFRQRPLANFLEGPVHALRTQTSFTEAQALYRAVKRSVLFDRKLKMFRLNAPLTLESYEIGRSKVFPPGWLENEAIFLHMTYKFLWETLRAGLVKEFYEDLRHAWILFKDSAVYGRSNLEHSSFLVSSRFQDPRLHGAGFVARLTGAAAEWISMVLGMALGPEPFRWVGGHLRFEPRPALAGWLFARQATDGFEKDTFGFKLFSGTWLVYRNPARRDTFGKTPLGPIRFQVRSLEGRESVYEGRFLPDRPARDLREGKLARVLIDLGSN